jgi:hypothetical protein
MNKTEELTAGCIGEWFYDQRGSDPDKKIYCWVMDESDYREYKKLTGIEAIRRIETCAGASYAVPSEKLPGKQPRVRISDKPLRGDSERGSAPR